MIKIKGFNNMSLIEKNRIRKFFKIFKNININIKDFWHENSVVKKDS